KVRSCEAAQPSSTPPRVAAPERASTVVFEFKLPDIAEGVHEGEIVQWHVKEGQSVKEDQDMVEVMTDKATVMIKSPRTGSIAQIRANEGQVVKVGDVIITINYGQAQAQA